jgi:hypothetical protein
MDGTEPPPTGQPNQQADPQQESIMRNIFLATIAVLSLTSGAAFAGNEQIYQGYSLPVVSAPALTETDTAAEYVAGPAITLSLSQVATNDTGNERPLAFDGQLASTGGAAFAQK